MATSETEIVVLVHGLWLNSLVTAVMDRRISREPGFDARRFGYPTNRRTLAENAVSLHEFVAALNGRTVHFVGHSLGGLVIWKCLRDYPGVPPGRCVFLGSPLCGSLSARRLSDWPMGSFLVGKSLSETMHGPESGRWELPRELGIIAGTQAVGMGRVVGNLQEPHDGTVMVSETQLDGATDHITVQVSHTGMLYSSDVSAQVLHFLRHGRFSRADATAEKLERPPKGRN